MSFIFPRHNERNGWPVDPEALNENFQEVVSEIQGALGEHNWRKDAFTNLVDLNLSESEAPVVCQSTGNWGNALDTASPYDPPYLGAPGTVAYSQWRMPNSYDWNVVGSNITTSGGPVNPMSKTLTTRAGLLWIMASFQQHGQWDNWGSEPTEMPGVQYAICIDGSIVHETNPGALDTGNDRAGSAIGVRRCPIVIDALYPITPGKHTIELKARLGQGRIETSYDQDTDFYQIDAYQFIIIEMR